MMPEIMPALKLWLSDFILLVQGQTAWNRTFLPCSCTPFYDGGWVFLPLHMFSWEPAPWTRSPSRCVVDTELPSQRSFGLVHPGAPETGTPAETWRRPLSGEYCPGPVKTNQGNATLPWETSQQSDLKTSRRELVKENTRTEKTR